MSKSTRRAALGYLAIGALAASCSMQPRDRETEEIIDNLIAAGFPADDIEVEDGQVVTGGDAVVSLAASRELLQTDAGTSHEHYRSLALLAESVRNICVNGAVFTEGYSTALDLALENWNELGLTIRFTRTTGPAPGCDALITAGHRIGTGGRAGFPSGGLPYHEFTIGEDLIYFHTLDHAEMVMTHELGHTVGLRHADYYDRSISCGVGGDEGPEDEGVAHIPGTPTTAALHGSLMNACYGAVETGEWTATDVTALRILYGAGSTWATHGLWSTFYTDAQGWAAARAMWSSVEYPDVSGDGRNDVCGRSTTQGILCGKSNGMAFTAPVVWAAAFNDAGGWAAESSWATIAYPDVNGDGRADVCGRSSQGIVCARSLGGMFATPSLWSADFSDAAGWAAERSRWATVRFPDVNGDGRADVCGRTATGLWCALSTGTGFGPLRQWSTAFGDADGWHLAESAWGTLRFADLNGDEMMDVCGRNAQGLICGVSIGSRFSTARLWSSAFSDAAGWAAQRSWWSTLRFPDVNGDGKADVCGRNSTGVVCGLSLGLSLAAPTLWAPALGDANPGRSGAESFWGTISFPDISGDGRADLCARADAGMMCGVSNSTAFLPDTQRSAHYNFGSGFDAEARWRSIRFLELEGDGRADVCARSGDGIFCSSGLMRPAR